jgi:DNA-binding winged helix-turn-helix (wHTH) protein/tetratricopeptide (TPR) repeat protein
VSTASAPLLYRIDDIEIDLARGVLRRGGEELHLKPKAFAILLHLIASRDRLVTREELLELFWKDAAVTDDALTQCIAELRRAFQDDARNPRYLKTVPRRGFRFVAEVEEVRPAIAVVAREEVTTVEIEETYSDEPRSLRAGPRNKRYLVWTAAAALVLGSAGLYLAARGGVPAEPRPAAGKRQVVVLPFENQSGQSDVDWLRDGLPDMLTATLTRTPSVDVLSREQAALWIGRIGKTGLPAAIEVARRGHAQIAVTGSFARLGSAIRVDARIYDGGTGALVAADSLTAEPDQVLRQVDYLGGRLAARLRAKSGGDDRRDLASLMTNNLEAYRDYELGMRLVDSMQVREGIQLLEKAIALDPKFVMAYARVGYAYAVGGYELEKGRPYLEKAFQMGERLTAKDRERLLAWYALAHRDYQDAIRRYAALIAAYPNETEAYRRLGSLLRGESRDEEAIAVERQALAIDPEDPRIYNALAAVSSETGRHEQAIEAARQFTVLSPGDANALDTLGLAYDFAGRYVEAEAAFRQAIALNPAFEVPRIHLVQLHGRMGREREARQESLERAAATRSLVDCSRYWGEIAWAAWRRGDAVAAREAWAQVDRLMPQPGTTNVARLLVLPKPEPARVQPGRGARYGIRGQYFFQAQLARMQQRPEEMLANLRLALQSRPQWGSREILEDALADGYLEVGRVDDAIAEYRRALALFPGMGRARFHLAQALEKRGRIDEAKAEYRRFLEVWKNADADLPEIREGRRKAQ